MFRSQFSDIPTPYGQSAASGLQHTSNQIRAKIRYVGILSPQLRRIILPYLCSIGFWIALSVLMAWQQYTTEWTAGTRVLFSLELLLFAARYFTFALLTPPIFYLVRRFAIRKDKAVPGTIAYLFGFVSFVISYACIRWTVAPIWSVRLQAIAPRSLEGFKQLLTGMLGDLLSVYIAIVIAAHAYEYFKRVRAQELEQNELQQALAASELQALKSQLHPHFLFNTLHGISTLIDTDRARAKAMVIQLSSLLRTALQHGSSDLISLHEEMKFVQSYLDLEKMRLGARLEVRLTVDPGTLQVLVPQLILQPLVENALVHGIACCREGGWIDIGSQRVDGMIELQVRNSVGGKSEGGIGLGLPNTKARLKHLYSDQAMLSFAVDDAHVATAALLFPAFGSHRHVSTHGPMAAHG